MTAILVRGNPLNPKNLKMDGHYMKHHYVNTDSNINTDTAIELIKRFMGRDRFVINDVRNSEKDLGCMLIHFLKFGKLYDDGSYQQPRLELRAQIEVLRFYTSLIYIAEEGLAADPTNNKFVLNKKELIDLTQYIHTTLVDFKSIPGMYQEIPTNDVAKIALEHKALYAEKFLLKSF